MRLPCMRFSVRRMMFAVASLFLVIALADLALNHRRVVRFRAAWAYDEQYRGCTRLAEAYALEAARERQEAGRWPEGSSQRGFHLQAAASDDWSRADVARVGESARLVARELRRLARIPR